MSREPIRASDLVELGFPDTAIAEILEAQRLNLFDFEPPADLADRISERLQPNG